MNQYEGGSGVAGGGFASYILNTWSPRQNRAASDFDATHQFNANWMYELPIGKGKNIATRGLLGAVVGNWEITGIFRMTSGFPTTVNDGNYWPTNWENTANAALVGPKPKSGTFMVNGSPNIFQTPTATIGEFRYAYPGESGERNLSAARATLGSTWGWERRGRSPSFPRCDSVGRLSTSQIQSGLMRPPWSPSREATQRVI